MTETIAYDTPMAINPDRLLAKALLDNDTNHEDITARELRNQWLDSLLNPDGRLPEVALQEDKSALDVSQASRNDMIGVRICSMDGEDVGLIRLTIREDQDGDGQTATINQIDAQKNKGYGKAAYLGLLQALPESVSLISDRTLSSDSIKLWRWLEGHNLAMRQYDGPLTETEKGDMVYIGGDGKTPLFRSLVPDFQSPAVKAVMERSNPTIS